MNKYKVKNTEQPEFDEQDKRIYEEFIELGWLIPQTEEEVNRAEKALEKTESLSLPAELEDSLKILERIKNRKKQDRNIAKIEQIKPFLGFVSDETGLPPSKIEQKLKLPTEFLIQISENSEVVSEPVREKIVEATLLHFPQLNRNSVSHSLKQSSQKMAAARDAEYTNEEITFEKILDSSEISNKEFWLELNKKDK